MTTRLSLLFFLLSAECFPLTAALLPVSNTGVDASGQLLALGSLDPHYQLTSFDPDPGQPPAALAPAVYTLYNNIWIPNRPNSEWISPSADSSAVLPTGTYTYTTTFTLAAADVATFYLSGEWSSENEGVDILLNGVSQAFQIADASS